MTIFCELDDCISDVQVNTDKRSMRTVTVCLYGNGILSSNFFEVSWIL